jgi:hypothetical protein
MTVVQMLGAGCFGLVVGWITYRTLRRRQDATSLGDIAAVVGAVGGGGVTALFKDADLFASYSIGLATGFFLYFLVSLGMEGKKESGKFMGD